MLVALEQGIESGEIAEDPKFRDDSVGAVKQGSAHPFNRVAGWLETAKGRNVGAGKAHFCEGAPAVGDTLEDFATIAGERLANRANILTKSVPAHKFIAEGSAKAEIGA